MPTSSSCRGLVAFGHLEGPLGPLNPTPSPQVTVDSDPSFIVMQTLYADFICRLYVQTLCADFMCRLYLQTLCADFICRLYMQTLYADFIVILIILTNCSATQWLLVLATWQQCKQDRITVKDPRPTAFSVPKRNNTLVV